MCFGFTSREDGRIYNAAGLWGADGKRIGVYHKTHLQTHDLQFSPGESLPVWPTPWGPTGVMICADRRWPETARTLRLQGARLILNPSYGMCHEENEWWMRTRSYENQCFIAFAHPKVGFVVDPRGKLAAKLDGEGPGVLVYEVDLAEAKDDNHIRDRRPDLYRVIGEAGASSQRSASNSGTTH
jgi:predicted amidohydrolase